jgi:glycosyltransferase involved in cell wall biosynthesis
VDGVTGLVVDNEPHALAGAINRLLVDPELRRRLGSAARSAVLNDFQMRHYFDRLLGLADSLSGTVADT